MKYVKGDKFITYELVVDNKYPFLYEIKGKTLYLNVPKKVDEQVVYSFFDKQFDILYKKINDLEFRKFYGHKVVHYLGKTYFAKTKRSKKEYMTIKGATITIYSDIGTISRNKAIYRHYLKNAVEQTIVKLYHQAEYDFKETIMPKIIVSLRMKDKNWGLNAGDTIYLSCELGRYDEQYIKLIFYHELCHCLIKDHSESFYDLEDKKLKNARELEKKFDEIYYLDEF